MYVCMYMYVCVYVCIYVVMCVCMYICSYVCMYVYICVCLHITYIAILCHSSYPNRVCYSQQSATHRRVYYIPEVYYEQASTTYQYGCGPWN